MHEELEESSEESFQWPEIKASDGRKMKTVFWDKMNQNKIMTSIWVYVYKFSPDIHLKRILELYEDKIHRKKGKSNQPKTELTTSEITKDTSQTKLTFIYDDQRKRNLSIGITKLLKINKLTWPQIIDMILKVDEQVIGLDPFLSIKVLAPQANEMELCRGFKGDKQQIDIASRWVHELQAVPNFMARFECLEFVQTFETRFGKFQNIVKAYKDFCDFLIDSQDLKKLLRVLLDAGNIVNSGTRRANAFGFTVSFGSWDWLFGSVERVFEWRLTEARVAERVFEL